MAYQSYFPDENQKKKDQTGSGASTVISGGGSQPSAPASTGGSGFVNLDKYLNANAGQSQGLVDTVTGGVKDQVKQQQDTVSKLNEEAQKEIAQKNKSAETGGLIDESGKAKTDNVQDWAKGASDVINSDYKYGLADETQGKVNEAINNYGNVKNTLENVDNRNYQQQALKNAYNKQGNYTSGFGALDTFLLNADQSSRDQINATKALGKDFNYDPINESTFKGYEDEAARQFAENQAKVRGAASGLQQDYKSRYKDAQRQAAYENAFLDEKADVLNRYLEYVKGTSLGSYLPDDLTGLVTKQGGYKAGNYFADKDAADLAALNNLLGDTTQYDTTKGEGSVGIDYDKIMASQTGPRAGYQGYHEFDYDPKTNQIKRRFVNYEQGAGDWATSDINAIDPTLAEWMRGKGY